MLALNKKALYQMAQNNSSSNATEQWTNPESGHEIQLRPVPSTSGSAVVPDGRFVSSLSQFPAANSKVRADHIALRRPGAGEKQRKSVAVSKTELRSTLGYGALGLMANAYVEQSMMTADELESVQRYCYGLDGA